MVNEHWDENRLQEQLRLLGRKLALADKFDAACCGTTVGKCRALQEIGRNLDINTKQLAEALNVDKSTISRTIDNLVKQDWVIRRPDHQDRRYTILNLTTEGQIVSRDLAMQINRYHKQLLNAIPEKKRTQVMESLDLLLKALDEAEKGPGGGSSCC